MATLDHFAAQRNVTALRIAVTNQLLHFQKTIVEEGTRYQQHCTWSRAKYAPSQQSWGQR